MLAYSQVCHRSYIIAASFILRKCLNQTYLSDWKDTSESLKDGKLTTYLFLKTNFKLEKYLTLVKDVYIVRPCISDKI
jgi:hypothetical protein